MDGINAVRVNTRTGEKEIVKSYCYTDHSRLRLLGDMWASKENAVDYEGSVIYPKSVLFPLVEMTIKPGHPQQCGRFLELRH